MRRLTLGSSSISDLEKKYVQEVLDSNFISPGKVVEWVEKECAKLHGKKYSLACNSGQAALHIALQTLKETKFADRFNAPLVAVPTCTYISSLAAVVLSGCRFVLVDVELETSNMCPRSLSKVLKEQIKKKDPIDIIMPVHLYGKACSLEIRDLAFEYNLWIVEDACESTFVPNIGWGHILTTSFFSNHLISGGSGGLIMTNNPDIDLYCWKLINHGRASRFSNDDINQITEKFKFNIWGHSSKWSDINAAVVKAQIERKDTLYTHRKNNARYLLEKLEPFKDRLILPNPDGHCWMMFPLIVKPNSNIDSGGLIKVLNSHNIEIRRMMPITNQEVVTEYAKQNWNMSEDDLKRKFPNADLINTNGLYLGVHPELIVEDMEFIANTVITAIK